MSSAPETATQVTSPSVFVLSVTDRAVSKVKEFASKMPDAANKPLRVFIQGGGCSGFQYGFSFDDARTDDDSVFTRDGVKLLVDSASLDLLAGSEIDFVEELVGASFQVRNPNATSSCGCGSSFSV